MCLTAYFPVRGEVSCAPAAVPGDSAVFKGRVIALALPKLYRLSQGVRPPLGRRDALYQPGDTKYGDTLHLPPEHSHLVLQENESNGQKSLTAGSGTGNCQTAENFISDQLLDTISYFDYGENYYHGFLAGLLSGAPEYQIISNRESGNGRTDLLIKSTAIHFFVMQESL